MDAGTRKKARRRAPRAEKPRAAPAGAPPGRRARAIRAATAAAALAAFLAAGVLVMSRPDAPDAGWSSLVHRWSGEYGVDPDLVFAVIECESAGRPGAVSRAGAVGLMQIMPATGSAIAAELDLPSPSRADLFDPEVNVRFGAFYLARMLDRFSDESLALAAYNAGPANVRRWMRENPGADGPSVVRASAYGETRAYVAKVLEARAARRTPSR